MALLPVLHYPDPRLRRQAEPVEHVDDALRTLIDDMFETMYEAPGIGLAAIQVDVCKRLIVVDISEDRTAPICLINPLITDASGHEKMDEGCLSVPGIYEAVERAAWIRVQALDRDGKPFELEAEGLLSACIQHEVDHLDGKLFVDYLTEMKRQRIRKKLEKRRLRTM
jgi:peptide deformylase